MSDRPSACVPAWASLFNRTRFDRFMMLIRERLERSGERFRIGEGCVDVERVTGVATLGLGNLLQICHRSPFDDWPKLIDEHFTALLRIGEPGQAIPGEDLLADPERGRSALRVRLLPANQLRGLEPVASRQDLPGVATTIVLDLPSDIRALTWTDLERLRLGPDESFALALDNVRRRHPPQCMKVEDDSAPVRFLYSQPGDWFAASHALLLDQHDGCRGRYGALVGVPHRHMVAVHPIEDGRVATAIERLAPFVRQCHTDGPGSISPALFWCHDGRFDLVDAGTKVRLSARIRRAGGG
ncbi:MAG: hypothetical protein HZB39_19530 [Planctomycetes bacterium]|nr:hypothetical protein [Planctomycetota bacterium]